MSVESFSYSASSGSAQQGSGLQTAGEQACASAGESAGVATSDDHYYYYDAGIAGATSDEDASATDSGGRGSAVDSAARFDGDEQLRLLAGIYYDALSKQAGPEGSIYFYGARSMGHFIAVDDFVLLDEHDSTTADLSDAVDVRLDLVRAAALHSGD